MLINDYIEHFFSHNTEGSSNEINLLEAWDRIKEALQKLPGVKL